MQRRASPPRPPIRGPIPRIEAPHPAVFRREHVDPKKPAIVTGAMSAWPAMTKWALAYLREAMAKVTLRTYVSSDGAFREYPQLGFHESLWTELTGPQYIDWISRGDRPPHLLIQHQSIPHRLPILGTDIRIPQYADMTRARAVNFGLARETTSLLSTANEPRTCSVRSSGRRRLSWPTHRSVGIYTRIARSDRFRPSQVESKLQRRISRHSRDSVGLHSWRAHSAPARSYASPRWHEVTGIGVNDSVKLLVGGINAKCMATPVLYAQHVPLQLLSGVAAAVWPSDTPEVTAWALLCRCRPVGGDYVFNRIVRSCRRFRPGIEWLLAVGSDNRLESLWEL